MKAHGFIKESSGLYSVSREISEQDILNAAREIISRKFRRGATLSSPQSSIEFLTHRIALLEHEVFGIIVTDHRHRILASEDLFTGTIDGASVYPREVVKHVLRLNGSACLFYHCHPSGVANPSAADRHITQRLKDALALVDVRVLDHIIIAGAEHYSFAQAGLL